MIRFFVAGAERRETERKIRAVGGFVVKFEPDENVRSAVKTSLALIDMADVAVFAPLWHGDALARVQHEYCALIGKPVMYEGLDGLTDGPITLK